MSRKQLADWKEQPPEQWLHAANHYLPPAVTAVLVVAIAYQLAEHSPGPSCPGATRPRLPRPPAPSNAPRSRGTASSYDRLIDSHLFGEAAKNRCSPSPAVVDAPDTTLSLTLTGILSREGDPNGQAIISANRGQEKTYHVGQAIDNANGTTLHSVYADRVLLNRGDRLETLRLPKDLSECRTGAAGSEPRHGPRRHRAATTRCAT